MEVMTGTRPLSFPTEGQINNSAKSRIDDVCLIPLMMVFIKGCCGEHTNKHISDGVQNSPSVLADFFYLLKVSSFPVYLQLS